VARTIADLAGRESIAVSDLAEAVSYRYLENAREGSLFKEVCRGAGI